MRYTAHTHIQFLQRIDSSAQLSANKYKQRKEEIFRSNKRINNFPSLLACQQRVTTNFHKNLLFLAKPHSFDSELSFIKQQQTRKKQRKLRLYLSFGLNYSIPFISFGRVCVKCFECKFLMSGGFSHFHSASFGLK